MPCYNLGLAEFKFPFAIFCQDVHPFSHFLQLWTVIDRSANDQVLSALSFFCVCVLFFPLILHLQFYGNHEEREFQIQIFDLETFSEMCLLQAFMDN